MEGIAASEHLDVLGQLAVPGGRALDGVESVDDGEAIGRVQLVERRGCGGLAASACARSGGVFMSACPL